VLVLSAGPPAGGKLHTYGVSVAGGPSGGVHFSPDAQAAAQSVEKRRQWAQATRGHGSVRMAWRGSGPQEFRKVGLYQLGNWKAGKTIRTEEPGLHGLYQLGNWKAGKTYPHFDLRFCTLYQLGNWKAGKTESRQGSSGFPVDRLRNRIIRLARKSAFRWKERLSGDSKAFLNAQIRRPLEGKIEHLRRDADAAHLRLPVERLFARQQIAKTPLVENLIGSVCITNSLARFCR